MSSQCENANTQCNICTPASSGEGVPHTHQGPLQPETTLASHSLQSDKRTVQCQLFLCRFCSFETGVHCVDQVCLSIVLPQCPEHWISGLSQPASLISFEKEEPSGKLPPDLPLNPHAVGHMIAIWLGCYKENRMAGIG